MNRMLAAMLRVQWTRVRAPTVLVAVLLFVLPLVIVRLGAAGEADMVNIGAWLRAAATIGRAFPIAALLIGLYLGVAAWQDDTRGRHVYALTLPLSRELYVVYRFLAGAAPILVLVVALGAGSLLASSLVHLPSGIHAYPLALTVRWMLAAVVCYALFFAIGSATRRAALIVLGVFVGILVAELAVAAMELELDIIGTAYSLLTTPPGPLSMLLGNWSLFDV